MPTTATTMVFDIRRVANVAPGSGTVRLTFSDGSAAYLEDTHPDFDTLMVLLDGCGRRPLGVMLDATGKVLDLNEAHDVAVRSIDENPDDPQRVKVALWGFSPICYLTRDHPEFDRLHALLTAAAGTPARLWLANHSEMVREGLNNGKEPEVWWKIMDVRIV